MKLVYLNAVQSEIYTVLLERWIEVELVYLKAFQLDIYTALLTVAHLEG